MKVLKTHYAWGLIAACAVWCGATAIAWADVGVVQSLPLPRVRMRNSLTVEIDTRGVLANGYRSIRVKISNTPTRGRPPVPVTADRRVRVLLEPTGIGHLTSVSASQVIEIPEKQSSAEAVISVPGAGDWHYLQVSVYEGGDKLEDVSGAFPLGWFGMRGDAESIPTFLIIDADAPDRATRDQLLSSLTIQGGKKISPTYRLPDISPLLTTIPTANFGGMATPVAISSTGTRLSDAEILSISSQHGKVQLVSPNEMPKRWIELSCFDVAFISLDDLAQMAKQNASKRRALVDWVSSGSSLVVHGVGDNYSRVSELEKLLELKQSADPSGALDSASAWDTKSTVGAKYATRPAGLGLVVAIAKDDPISDTSFSWNGLLESIPDQNRIWMTRHGMSYQSYNRGLWNWYIPGVGAAPVFSFLLLATLFAIVIGPVNYLVLGRAQRLYLLLVTVPVGAAVVTFGLFGYAVLSDGLGTKSRIRSFTVLDQRTQHLASWSRQSYFASVVPSQGLKFPDDAVVWPLEEYPRMNRNGLRHRVVWEPEGQRLTSGYLSSRRLTQLMVVRAAKSEAKLAVAPAAANGTLRVSNGLGGAIERLVLCDRSGNYFRADAPIENGKPAELRSISKDEAQREIRQVIADHRPDFPEGYDPAAEERRMTGNMYWGNSSTSAVLESSILETNLQRFMAEGADALQPGSYFAVLDRNPEVHTGISQMTELKSFHVVKGNW